MTHAFPNRRSSALVGFVDDAGREHVQPADTVVVAAYPLGNVKLLLSSRSDAHPDGVGNDEGLVGRNFTYQLVKSPVSGVFEGRRFNQIMGNSCLQAVIHDSFGRASVRERVVQSW